jgi:transposase
MPFLKGSSMDLDVQSYNLGHLGIVAGIFDALKLDEVIDSLLPKQGSRNLPHSVIIKAMILNGLGFTHQRLYLFPNYFMTIPTEKLLGKGVTPSALNDDAVGRTLDAIYDHGATELFNEITLHVMKQFSLGTQLIHVDTTNFSVHGKYEKDSPDGTDSIRITFGHAKDGRTDLKRFVLGLVTNQFGLPLFTEAFSGNESDKNSIIKMIQKTQQAINLDDKSCWVADSALYTEDNIKLLGTGTKWITHVPATVGEAERLLNADLDFTPGIDPRYAFYVTDLSYGGIPQRAVVVWSEEMKKRNEQTFDKKIQKETSQAEKDLKKLMSRKFACAPDAEKEAKIWASAHKHHLIKNLQITPVAEKVEKKRGRPKKDESVTVSFKIEAQIELNDKALDEERKLLGRFVLASNEVDLDPEDMLNYYKGQQTVEHGFRFLKDKCFHVSEVYLKKEERIEALCMIMVLSLLIYSFAEWRLREKLKETGQTVPNQLNKPTQKPTMRWVFEIFMGVIESVVTSGGKIIKVSVNLTSTQITILKLLGQECENYYGMN